ncbi:MAG: Transcription regulator [contains diacylglycerol kinase catalytic domain], partial [uncultured Rubrobacteraceae bacterium]
ERLRPARAVAVLLFSACDVWGEGGESRAQPGRRQGAIGETAGSRLPRSGETGGAARLARHEGDRGRARHRSRAAGGRPRGRRRRGWDRPRGGGRLRRDGAGHGRGAGRDRQRLREGARDRRGTAAGAGGASGGESPRRGCRGGKRGPVQQRARDRVRRRGRRGGGDGPLVPAGGRQVRVVGGAPVLGFPVPRGHLAAGRRGGRRGEDDTRRGGARHHLRLYVPARARCGPRRRSLRRRLVRGGRPSRGAEAHPPRAPGNPYSPQKGTRSPGAGGRGRVGKTRAGARGRRDAPPHVRVPGAGPARGAAGHRAEM